MVAVSIIKEHFVSFLLVAFRVIATIEKFKAITIIREIEVITIIFEVKDLTIFGAVIGQEASLLNIDSIRASYFIIINFLVVGCQKVALVFQSKDEGTVVVAVSIAQLAMMAFGIEAAFDPFDWVENLVDCWVSNPVALVCSYQAASSEYLLAEV